MSPPEALGVVRNTDGSILWQAFRSDRKDAQVAALIQHYLPLVRRVVRQMGIYRSASVDLEDLMQHALLGLWTAIGRYEEERGVPFEAYAIPRIRGSVNDALRRQDPLSRTERDLLKRVDRIVQGHLQAHDEAPAEEHLAEEAGVDPSRLRALLVRAQPWISLDAMLEDGSGAHGALAERLPDEQAPDPRRETMRRERVGQFRAAFKRLPVRQQKILYLYYFEDLTLKEIGATMELSEARICQLHAAALLVLRALLTGTSGERPEGGGEERP